jgi:hypothetical protein
MRIFRIDEDSRGLGDTIEKITQKTGIKTVTEFLANKLGVDDCGCEARKNALNELVPYKKKENVNK